MENQDDAVYCKILNEVLQECEKELQKETLDFNGYMKERQAEEKYIREAIEEEYNKVLDQIQNSYQALIQRVKKELDQNLFEYHTKTELILDEKMNEALRDIELEILSHFNKLVQENESLDRQFDNEQYEVDKLRMDLLNLNTEIEKYIKPKKIVHDEKMVFVQFQIDQIKNKNIEITQLYDRLSQNLLNKITQIEEDIERMEHLCNYLQYDDIVNNANNPTSQTILPPDVNRSTQSNIENRSENQDSSIDYEAVD